MISIIFTLSISFFNTSDIINCYNFICEFFVLYYYDMKLNDILRVEDQRSNTQIRNKDLFISKKSSCNKIGEYRFNSIIRYFFSFLTVLFFTTLIFISTFVYFRVVDLRNSGIKDVSIIDPFKYVSSAVSKSDEKNITNLKQTNGRTNVLIVGVDSRKDLNSLLTDSIILLSYNHTTNKLTSISIPRDLRVMYNKNTFTKINSVLQYAFNELKEKNENDDTDFFLEKSFDKLINTIKDVLDINVHYGVLINFDAFKQIIDMLGGIDVYVERSFIDYEFPNNNDTSLITVSFKQGWERMNGERALQFARSRKGNNGEGTDYARAKRQQIIINAVRQKLLQSDFFTQINNFNSISSILGKNIKFFHFSSNDIDILIQNKNLLKSISLNSFVITPEIGSYIGHILKTGDFEDGVGWVIYPVKSDFSELAKFVHSILEEGAFWDEKANVFLGYTNFNAYSNYLKIKKDIFSKYKKLEFSDKLVVFGTNLSTELDTLFNKNASGVCILILNSDKQETKRYYYDLIKNLNIDVDIIDISNESSLKNNIIRELGNFDVVILAR